mgnify:CR=1 FL=1
MSDPNYFRKITYESCFEFFEFRFDMRPVYGYHSLKKVFDSKGAVTVNLLTVIIMRFRDESFGRVLLSTLLAVDGLILTLSWGLFDWNMPCAVKTILLPHLKWGLVLLLGSLVSGILCFQFMVARSQSTDFEKKSVMESNQVAISFFVCWICFLVGIVIFVVGIWRV